MVTGRYRKRGGSYQAVDTGNGAVATKRRGAVPTNGSPSTLQSVHPDSRVGVSSRQHASLRRASPCAERQLPSVREMVVLVRLRIVQICLGVKCPKPKTPNEKSPPTK